MKSDLAKKAIFDILLLFSVILFVFVFFEPTLCYNAVRHGMELSAGFLVPTLFLSTVFTALIYSFISARGLFPEKYAIMLLGFIGGYPTCAYLTDEAYKNGDISKKDALALTYSVTCAGPAFIIGGIGLKFLNNTMLGVMMYASVIIPQFVLFMILKDKKSTKTSLKKNSLPDALCSSVSGASVSSLYLTGYVAFFSALCTMLSRMSGGKCDFLLRFLEITYAVENLTNNKPQYYIFQIVFLTALGDICVHMQIKQNLKHIDYSYVKYLLLRVISAAASTLIFIVLTCIFSVDLSVASLVISPVYANIPASVFLILLSVYTVLSKNKGPDIAEPFKRR